MVAISPRKLSGPWKAGYALDIQTVSSTYIGDNEYGHPQFDTKRSEIGELLYRLKYSSDKSVIAALVKTAVHFLEKQEWPIDVVVPVPPSRPRPFQPVLALSKLIAQSLEIDFCADCVVKVKDTPELKSIFELEKRMELLKSAHRILREKLDSRTVLVFDDLYRSGATLKSVAEAVSNEGNSKAIYALTLTTSRRLR